MPLTTWISGLLGSVTDIPGKILNWKKTKLEIDKLKRESSLITPATLEDVKQYDPKTRRLIEKILKGVLVVLIFIGSVMAIAVPYGAWEDLKSILRFIWQILVWASPI